MTSLFRMSKATERIKLDNRLRLLIENGVNTNQRTVICLVGEQGRNQVVHIHNLMSKANIKSRPTVLWCYKKELGFSTHRKKRMKLLQKRIKDGTMEVNEDDPFELFICATEIRWTYYKDTQKILGKTYDMLVLQDFEAITPNLLARKGSKFLKFEIFFEIPKIANHFDYNKNNRNNCRWWPCNISFQISEFSQAALYFVNGCPCSVPY